MAIVVLSSALLTVLTFLRVLFSLTGPEALAAGYERVALHFLVFLAATVPFQLYTFLRVLSDDPVLGANDNLSGVANCLLLAEHLSRPEARPRRTTVWLVSFGCEECGIRGSKRFIERHREDHSGCLRPEPGHGRGKGDETAGRDQGGEESHPVVPRHGEARRGGGRRSGHSVARKGPSSPSQTPWRLP